MQILMIPEKDASCMSLAPIADEFLKRGHHIDIYALYNSKTVLREFDPSIPVYDYDALTEEAIEKADIIFASVLAGGYIGQKGVLTTKKPIFTQNYLINKQVIWGGDICFEPSNEATVNQYTPYLNCARISIGEPKYDNIRFENKGKGILFIDSGHFPFGLEGKRALASLLLDICNAYPQFVLTIKPRFLPEDDVITHTNYLHLYDVITEQAGGVIPKNLNMLYEHKNLTELINENHTVICMYTTAYSGVVAANKGLIILDDIPSDDTYDLRLKVLLRIRENMKGSEAIVDYRHVKEALPNGVIASDSYKDFLRVNDTNVAEKIVEISEYIVDNFYCRNIMPRKANCDYAEYKKALEGGGALDWNEIIRKRCMDYMILKTFIQIDFRVKADVCIENALHKIEEWMKRVDMTDKFFVKELEKKGKEIQNNCIIENANLLMQDEIDYGVLLNTLLIQKKYAEIKDMPKRELGADYFYRAKVAFVEGKSEQEFFELEQYMKISLNRTYVKEISDMPDNKFWGFSRYITLLAERRNIEKAKEYYEYMKQFFNCLYKVDASEENVTNRNKRHYLLLEKTYKVLQGA